MKIALLGLGVVGYGVYEILNEMNIDISIILVRNLNREVNTKLTDNFDDIINDDSIDVVIEATGNDASLIFIKKALEKGKHVITASKIAISSELEQLTQLKNKNNCCLYYEACVGGGVSIINEIYKINQIDQIISIEAILNGTTNFVLDMMYHKDKSFKEALEIAQKNGFAEADSSSDFQGIDIARKLSILSSIAYKGVININKAVSLENISLDDIRHFKSLGFKIKYMAKSTLVGNEVRYSITPAIVDKDSYFYNVSNEENLIVLKTRKLKTMIFGGLGAGRMPTASSMCLDLMSLLNNSINYSFENLNDFVVKEDTLYKNLVRIKDEI